VDQLIQDGQLNNRAAFILGLILGTWVTFRQSHNVNAKTIACNDKTKALFEALAKYEELMIGGND